MDLLQSMQRGNFPLSLYRHSVLHLLLHVVKLLNRRAVAGHTARFIKVLAHRGRMRLLQQQPTRILGWQWILAQRQCTSCTGRRG